MNRFFLLIVVALFGLASMSGPTMAAGFESGSFWTVANQDVCVERTPHHKAAVFKPCSKRINGQSISCEQVAAILPLPIGRVFDERSLQFTQQATHAVVVPDSGRRFKPPKLGQGRRHLMPAIP